MCIDYVLKNNLVNVSYNNILINNLSVILKMIDGF